VTLKNTGVMKGNVTLSELGDRLDSAQGNVKGSIAGLGGDDNLIGSRLSDVVTGGVGDDTLTGGVGRDRFVFYPKDLGTDLITDFQVGQDSLDVSAFNFGAADVQTVINTAQQLGEDTRLTLAPKNTVLLVGVQASMLTLTDFMA
jgi:Ca2+-binding RTX toxin-like protein